MFPSSASSFYPCHPYDGHHHLYTPYGDRYSGMDSAARRKNATRETTNTLKAWLYEHRKNPYPTKGEKIMLAIITKMTLTQVSTWFANARRRLKKENKMTWEPRNKTSDSHDNDDDKDSLSGSRDNASIGDSCLTPSDGRVNGSGHSTKHLHSQPQQGKSARGETSTSSSSTSSQPSPNVKIESPPTGPPVPIDTLPAGSPQTSHYFKGYPPQMDVPPNYTYGYGYGSPPPHPSRDHHPSYSGHPSDPPHHPAGGAHHYHPYGYPYGQSYGHSYAPPPPPSSTAAGMHLTQYSSYYPPTSPPSTTSPPTSARTGTPTNVGFMIQDILHTNSETTTS